MIVILANAYNNNNTTTTDLYVVNQESTDLIREAHMGDVSFSLNGNNNPR